MRDKVLVMTVGCILLAPIFLALISDNLFFVFGAIIYGIILWLSPNFCTKVRKFWRKFYRINLEWMNE